MQDNGSGRNIHCSDASLFFQISLYYKKIDSICARHLSIQEGINQFDTLLMALAHYMLLVCWRRQFASGVLPAAGEKLEPSAPKFRNEWEGVKKFRRVGDPAYNPEVMPLDSL
jgi:hypothetical protein